LTPITEATVYLKVEAYYAAAAEGALHLAAILSRRMRISIEYPHRGVDCAHEVAEVVAPVPGWSAEDVDREVSTYQGPRRSGEPVADAARRRVRGWRPSPA
jgi:glycerol-3-phosphate dehydrogenase